MRIPGPSRRPRSRVARVSPDVTKLAPSVPPGMAGSGGLVCAHAVQHAHHGNSGASDTEELRQAFVHYRALFEELVQER
jgi:hypothetical protein